jgi:hypothetical protein
VAFLMKYNWINIYFGNRRINSLIKKKVKRCVCGDYILQYLGKIKYKLSIGNRSLLNI